ncbi:MAG: hypothetical protein ACRDP6_03205, partial [Actinoallomurus sp.]
AVLSGGGTLLLLSLVLGWRQRRRRPSADDEDEDVPEESGAVPVAARSAGRPSELSSWDRRPSTPPPSRRPSSSGTSSGLSPWERRPPEASGEVPPWETPSPEAAPPPPASWDHRQPSADSWDPSAAEPPPPGWERHDEPPSPRRPRHGSPAEPPPEPPLPGDGWDRSAASSGWDAPAPQPGSGWDPPAASSGWDDPAAASSPSPSGWDDPQADTPGSDSGARNVFDAMEPYENPAPYDARGDSHRPLDPREPLESYDPPPPARTNGNGAGNHRPPASRDLRVAGGHEPDPLTDDRIDSSNDVGTPLADESWDSIRRGFDRLKDASNWESLAKGGLDDAGDLPAQDAFDETASIPIIDPDEDGEK